ncbi:hypothetical protein WG901_13285 [Novosphingobium sp. PS1R-30]|uniref:DUF2384 domain-containing protein n=1 Tax=Novosphingobium anseongense TaxID=3133436 RepID=A0ABU8RY61_9SPHN
MIEAKAEETVSLRDHRRYSIKNRRRLSGPALRTFTAISDGWNLSRCQRCCLLGGRSTSAYHRWERRALNHSALVLTTNTLFRISLAFRIHRTLTILFEGECETNAWLRNCHLAEPFNGLAPVVLMIDGGVDGLLAVCRFLEGASQGINMQPNSADVGFQPYSDDELVIADESAPDRGVQSDEQKCPP